MNKEIKFTDKAIKQINNLLLKKDKVSFFRIAIKGGGCSGFQYDFSFDNKHDKNDLKFNNILIDKKSAELLKGSEVDFVSALIGDSLKFQIHRANHLAVVVFLFLFNDHKFMECKFCKSKDRQYQRLSY